jgi:hypothetical protein
MIKSTTWNIHKSDGSYVGQASGFCEQVAFSKCMSITGMQIIEREIKAEGLPDGSTNISYGSENFFMSPQV